MGKVKMFLVLFLNVPFARVLKQRVKSWQSWQHSKQDFKIYHTLLKNQEILASTGNTREKLRLKKCFHFNSHGVFVLVKNMVLVISKYSSSNHSFTISRLKASVFLSFLHTNRAYFRLKVKITKKCIKMQGKYR